MGSGIRNTDTARAIDFTKTWRYKAGLTLIIVGNGILLLGIVMPALGAGAGTVGTMVVGGEVISLASIAFLGKEGFKAIKNKALGFIKSTYTGAVGPTRHYLGIILLLTSQAILYINVIYLWQFFERSADGGLLPIIWGLERTQQDSLLLTVFIIGEICFLVSIYALGADWWGKFRGLFVWKEQEGK